MTEHIQINDVAPRVQYLADGVQSAFTFPFAIFADNDLEVWQDENLQSGGYTVSGAGISTGGTALFATPPTAGTRITLRRRLPIRRTTDYQADGLIRAKTLNDEMDYQVAALQQVAEVTERSLRRSATSSSLADLTLPEPAPNRGLKWNAVGNGLVNSANDPDAVGDATAAAAQALAAAVQAQSTRDQILATLATIENPLAQNANLADLDNVPTARLNLGLGSAATKDTGTAAGNVVALDAGGLIPSSVLPVSDALPVGCVINWAGPSAPTGTWLECNGQNVSRTTYPALFSAIGTTWGAGDGNTTFTMPDLRGRGLIGKGKGSGLSDRTLAATGGAETHVLSVTEMPSHSHGGGTVPASSDLQVGGGSFFKFAPDGGSYTLPSTGSQGSGGAHNNMSPFAVVAFYIKAG